MYLFKGRSVVIWVDLFIFDGTPESFDKNIVECPPTTIHTDGDFSLFQAIVKGVTRELRSLVRVENRGDPA